MAGRNGGGAVATVCVAGFEQSRTRRYLRAFVGGLPFIFGARLAGGCTSGHLLSGTSQMAISGLVFGLAVFASGIGEGLLAVAGGLVGATAFIFAFPALKPIFLDPADFGKLTIPGVLGLPALPTALVFAALLIGVIWGLTRLEQCAAGREAEVAG